MWRSARQQTSIAVLVVALAGGLAAVASLPSPGRAARGWSSWAPGTPPGRSRPLRTGDGGRRRRHALPGRHGRRHRSPRQVRRRRQGRRRPGAGQAPRGLRDAPALRPHGRLSRPLAHALGPRAAGSRSRSTGPRGLGAMTEHLVAAYRGGLRGADPGIAACTPWAHSPEGHGVNAHEIRPGLVYTDANLRVTAFPTRARHWRATATASTRPDRMASSSRATRTPRRRPWTRAVDVTCSSTRS